MAGPNVAAMLQEITRRANVDIAQAIGQQTRGVAIPGPRVAPTVPTILNRIGVVEPTFVPSPEIPIRKTVTTRGGGVPASGIGVIPDLRAEAVPTVTAPTTRTIEELQSVASMLAPQLETTPLTKEQLLGGDLFGLTAEQVTNVADTRLAQLQTKAATDKSALDFIRESTGVKTAEDLVKEKIKEESTISRQKFVTESATAEAVKAANREKLIENRKSKTRLAEIILEGKMRATTAQAAAKPVTSADEWKNKKAAILSKFSETNPLAAAGLTRIPDIDDAVTRLAEDAQLPPNQKMSKEEHDFFSKIVSLGAPPVKTEVE